MEKTTTRSKSQHNTSRDEATSTIHNDRISLRKLQQDMQSSGAITNMITMEMVMKQRYNKYGAHKRVSEPDHSLNQTLPHVRTRSSEQDKANLRLQKDCNDKPITREQTKDMIQRLVRLDEELVMMLHEDTSCTGYLSNDKTSEMLDISIKGLTSPLIVSKNNKSHQPGNMQEISPKKSTSKIQTARSA